MNNLLFALQKTTLIDYPGVVACTVFVYGCNFRCPFCHNPEFVSEKSGSDLLSEEEVMKFLKKRADILDGVVLCGGEPLIHSEIIPIIKKIKKLGYKIKVDTNGSRPDMIKRLLKERLVDYIAMDVKNSMIMYDMTAGKKVEKKKILESIKLIREAGDSSGQIDYEFRTTFVPTLHSIESTEELGELLKGVKRFSVQAFKPSRCVDESFNFVPPFTEKEMKKFKKIMEKYVDNVELKG